MVSMVGMLLVTVVGMARDDLAAGKARSLLSVQSCLC